MLTCQENWEPRCSALDPAAIAAAAIAALTATVMACRYLAARAARPARANGARANGAKRTSNLNGYLQSIPYDTHQVAEHVHRMLGSGRGGYLVTMLTIRSGTMIIR